MKIFSPNSWTCQCAFALILLIFSASAFSYDHATQKLNLGSIDFTPNGTQPGLASGIIGNDSCEGCHQGDAADESQMPYPTWSGSMMANAARDPMFWAAVDVANYDAPGIGDFCIRCHAPNAWLGGRVRKNGVGGLIDGSNGCLLGGDQAARDGKLNDYSGIGCHFCHRTMATGPLGQSALTFNANIWLDDTLNCTENGQSAGGPCRRGPYRYPDVTPTGPIARPPHGWKQDMSYKDSAYCGTCHDISSPEIAAGPFKTLILNTGVNSGAAFPIDRTYSEWLQSDYSDVLFRDGVENGGPSSGNRYGETCQSCHMRISKQSTARACNFNDPGTRTDNLAVHEFAGSNGFMVSTLKSLYGAALERESAFDRSLAWINDNLTSRSAQIAVNTQPLSAGAATLNASVRVTNLTGHKLPGGYSEGRRMWINFVVTDANSAVIFESGAYNPSTAVLTTDAQVKIYESKHGVWQRFGNTGVCVTQENGTGRKLFNMVLNNCIAKDNRIPPLGFRGGTNIETQPVNYSYPETSPGSGKLVNFDTTNYSVLIPANAVRPIRATATLKFQVMSKDYADFLKTEATSNNFQTENQLCNRTSDVGPADKSRGEFMFDAWNANGKSAPVNMVSASSMAASARN